MSPNNTLMSPGDILYTDGIDDGSQEHRELEAGMSEHWPLSAKDICDALLDFVVSRGDYLLRAGKVTTRLYLSSRKPEAIYPGVVAIHLF